MRRVTVMDVAQLAGVSAISVVQVTNLEPNVNSATRKKVRAALKKLNYQVNSTARQDAERRASASG